MKPQTNSRIIDSVLAEATHFLEKNQSVKGINVSYKYFTNHPIAPLNRKRLQHILDSVSTIGKTLKRPVKIVDFACGAGIVAAAMSLQGNRVLGIDSDNNEISLAQKFCDSLKAKIGFVHARTTSKQWERQTTNYFKGKPDVFLFAYAFHHFADILTFIPRLSRYMKPGSYIVMNEENPHSLLWLLKHGIRTVLQNDTDVEHQRTLKGWTELLGENGFRLVDTRTADFLPSPLVNTATAWSIVATYIKE